METIEALGDALNKFKVSLAASVGNGDHHGGGGNGAVTVSVTVIVQEEEGVEREVDFFHFSVIMASLAISFRSINNNSSSSWNRNGESHGLISSAGASVNIDTTCTADGGCRTNHLGFPFHVFMCDAGWCCPSVPR